MHEFHSFACDETNLRRSVKCTDDKLTEKHKLYINTKKSEVTNVPYGLL